MKTITMMQLRASPGEFAFRVRADGESFLVTYQGKPCFKMVPVEETSIVRPDGTIKGPKPLTMGLDLGGEYAGRLVYDKARRTIVCNGESLGIGIEDTPLA